MNESQEIEPLAPELARVLEVERHRPPPPDHYKHRVLSGVKAVLATPGGSGPTGTDSALALGKLGRTLLVFALGAASGATLHAVLSPTPTTTPLTAATPVAAPPPPPEPMTLDVPRARETTSSQPSRRTGLPKPTDPPTASADALLAAERALIEQARTALVRGKPSDAMAVLTKHAMEFPSGQLQEEREALTILALAGSGQRDQAKARAAEFRKTYPKSILLPTLERRLDK